MNSSNKSFFMEKNKKSYQPFEDEPPKSKRLSEVDPQTYFNSKKYEAKQRQPSPEPRGLPSGSNRIEFLSSNQSSPIKDYQVQPLTIPVEFKFPLANVSKYQPESIVVEDNEHVAHPDDHLTEYKPKKQQKGHKHHSYNPLAIPPDWEIATKHSLARRVAIEKRLYDENDQVCPCCGYEVEREDLQICFNTEKLNFLGAGLPLFYNFVVYCIFILFVQFAIKGGYNLMTNLMGTYCLQQNPSLPPNLQCPNTWILQASLANSINDIHKLWVQGNLDIIQVIFIMIILMMFRASQLRVDADIDMSYISPADYTVIVKNIPIGLKINYHEELTRKFEFEAVKKEQIQVKKIILIKSIGAITTVEKKLDTLVKQKQEYLTQHYMNFEDPHIEALDKEIHKVSKQVHQMEKKLELDDTLFEGIALISFATEKMKAMVIESNPFTFMDKVKNFYYHGKIPDMPPETFNWNGQKLFIEQAPEPNEIDWGNIHAKTKDKIIGRIKSHIYVALYMITIFFLLWGINIAKSQMTTVITQEVANGTASSFDLVKLSIIGMAVSWIIVFFNKFLIGGQIKTFVLLEKISTKTKFNVSMASKVVVALFINTCLLVYIIDILINKNIIGAGGFIEAETQVFITNAIVTVAVWIIDPWYIERSFDRNKALTNKETCTLTQQEANLLMEQVDYSQSKRYCDIIKTMWFGFFYGDVIPLGILLNLLCLIIYYYIDKYNVVRRRTIKDSITKELSFTMIDYLDLILILHAVGEITILNNINGMILWQHIVVLILAIIYIILPMDDICDKIFPIQSDEESVHYDEANKQFETDYDRENPVTRTFALKKWQKFQDEIKEGENKSRFVHNTEKHAGFQFKYNG